tara:strand:+ start:682 stop:984 length:303 start_codon:yes stop_codon:yes gene_type:complete
MTDNYYSKESLEWRRNKNFPPKDDPIDAVILNDGFTLEETLEDPKLAKEYFKNVEGILEEKILGSKTQDDDKTPDTPAEMNTRQMREARMQELHKRRKER